MNRIPWPLIKIYLKFLRLYRILHHFFIPLFKKKSPSKIFCIGAAKTGTASLSKALSILGYRSIHFLRTHEEPKEGWIEYIKKCKYDAYADAPMMFEDVYPKLDKIYPNSKFILTIRDTKSFERSFLNYFGSQWLKKYNMDIKELVQEFEDHNKHVLDYFKDRPSKLLVMNILEGDGWEKPCKFLNKPIPKKPFPYKNIGRYKKEI
ncbi:MAG: hypothetical protein NTV74_07140 [Euryarchaeota archaeon]|nr:hypothetical protein [Euryarchaeota archaeon]